MLSLIWFNVRAVYSRSVIICSTWYNVSEVEYIVIVLLIAFVINYHCMLKG